MKEIKEKNVNYYLNLNEITTKKIKEPYQNGIEQLEGWKKVVEDNKRNTFVVEYQHPKTYSYTLTRVYRLSDYIDLNSEYFMEKNDGKVIAEEWISN